MWLSSLFIVREFIIEFDIKEWACKGFLCLYYKRARFGKWEWEWEGCDNL